ncbi:MAG: hypothetical protein Q9181_007593 [Wetmoreana brouardii]
MERRNPANPAPIVVPPSQNFEGIDGPWSSFRLRIGSPPQDVNVMVATAGDQTWTVAPQGCLPSDPAGCAWRRGGIFDWDRSTTWVPNTSSPNKTDIFALGLNPRPSNFTNFSDPVPSYLSNLKKQALVPSLSWAYTAGNQYRLNKVLGSLTLGGYDASRFVPNNLTIPFNQQDDRDLTVNIWQISMVSKDGNQRTNLLTDGISAFVDSTISSIYLPIEVCRRFEDAFGIEWNESVQGYLVNATLHESLKSQNPSVRFTISNSSSTNSASVDINLPYAAFDLVAEPPLIRNKSRYFPLMRASNESQYTLGRTFLQEAYLIADYERHNFSISQCAWVENAQQDIVAIRSPTNETTYGHEHHLGSGAVAGIVIGCIIAISTVVLGLRFCSSRVLQSRRKPSAEDDDYSLGASSQLQKDGEVAEIDGTHPHGNEIDGRVAHGPELADIHPAGQELDGVINHEMEGSYAWPQGMETKDATASEKPA